MLNSLTGLRFYTALWVFIFHLSTEYIPIFNISPFNKGYLGVDVFFILSGFILTYVYYDTFFMKKIDSKVYFNFILKRFAKIYPMHLATFLIIGFAMYVGKFFLNQTNLNLHEESILQNFLMVHAWSTTNELSWNFPSWSISAEWFAYLFIFVGCGVIYRFNKAIFFFLATISVIIIITIWLSRSQFSLNNYTYNGLVRIIPEFVAGVLLGLIRIKKQFSYFKSTVLFVFSLGLLFLLLKLNLLDQLCILPFCGIIFALSSPSFFSRFFESKSLIYLGTISYSFYLTQFISFIIFEQIYKHLNLAFTFFDVILSFLIVFGLNLFLANLSFKFLEEPCRLLIIKKFQRK